MGSRSYRDLLVWEKSIKLCITVYKLCSEFPRSELYGLVDQMKRSSVSVASNIAEGQGREHVAEFRRFISIANGSLAELDTQRTIAERLGFLSGTCSAELEQSITEIQKMLYTLSTNLKPRSES
jgi:four helix bundle protein